MRSKLIIVTDLGLLRACRLETTLNRKSRLELLEEVVLEDAHQRVVEKATDLAGRHVSPTARHWGAPMTDDHNLRLEIKRRLIKQIAKHIQRLVNTSGTESCCLAAHKEINHLIVDALPKTVRARIETNLARDLVKAPRKELLAIFAPRVGIPKSRAAAPKPNHP
jgi:hypothetical protein